MRTVTIRVHDNADVLVHSRNCTSAIGHLSMWAYQSPRYAFVSIYVDENLEMSATYRETVNGPVNYEIGAILIDNELKYSFHS